MISNAFLGAFAISFGNLLSSMISRPNTYRCSQGPTGVLTPHSSEGSQSRASGNGTVAVVLGAVGLQLFARRFPLFLLKVIAAENLRNDVDGCEGWNFVETYGISSIAPATEKSLALLPKSILER